MISNLPPGCENDPNAPWNQKEDEMPAPAVCPLCGNNCMEDDLVLVWLRPDVGKKYSPIRPIPYINYFPGHICPDCAWNADHDISDTLFYREDERGERLQQERPQPTYPIDYLLARVNGKCQGLLDYCKLAGHKNMERSLISIFYELQQISKYVHRQD